MNDHDALLRAIGEHPEEDTPRLMYADWLEENDDPDRADFVRNQVELGRLDLNDPARFPLVWKNKRYLTDFVPHWKAELPRIKDVVWGDFNRGLIEEVLADTAEQVAAHAAEIFAVPGIHILRLRRLNGGQLLAERPELTQLRALRLVAGRAGLEALGDLLLSPHLTRLTVLDLHGNYAENTIAADLADGWFPDLTELWLGSNQVGDEGAEALANSSHLSNLRVLVLRNNPITEHAVRAALLRRFKSALKL